MANKKKLTIKELEERINIVAYNVNSLKAGIDNLGNALSRYIEFKQDSSDFRNFLENSKNVNKFNENGDESLENDTK